MPSLVGVWELVHAIIGGCMGACASEVHQMIIIPDNQMIMSNLAPAPTNRQFPCSWD